MQNTILSWLADEESKFIFTKRLEFNETGNMALFSEITDRYMPWFKNASHYNNLKNGILDKAKNKNAIWVWGGGWFGKDLVYRLTSAGIKIQGIIDSDANKKEVLGIATSLPDTVNYADIDCLIISMWDEAIAEYCSRQAAARGIEPDNIIMYRDYITAVYDPDQYFIDLVRYEEGECFVDGGAYDLAGSLRFAAECNRHSIKEFKIIAFEPDKIPYQNCVKIKEQHPELNIRLFHKGLYSEDTIHSFVSDIPGSSHIVENSGKGTDQIETARLDSVINEKVTFIKMDIEGAELEALKGAQDTIKKYKPKLAVCVYHKPEDILEIPCYIKELVPEYKLYFRHHSNYNGETVLYALPY